MVTPEIKDKLLGYLITQKKINFDINFNDLYEQTGISYEVASIILQHFHNKGFITTECYKIGCWVRLNVEIYDFFNHGGFTAQEELLRANLEKLNLELLKLSKELEPSKLETINTITSVVSNIAAALGLFK